VTATTTTGSGTPASLLVSKATSVSLPANASTSLFQNSSATVTGSGHTCLFLGRTDSSANDFVQISINVDGTDIFDGSAGDQIVVSYVLSSGSHTITFNAFALNSSATMTVASLSIVDTGL
jgi:hypothetical protein